MNIVILSRNATLYSTESLVIAARKRNHSVKVLDHMMCDIIVEPNKSKLLFNNQVIQNVDAILPRIGTTATTHGATVIRHFTLQGIYSTLNADSLIKTRDKLSCLQILASQNILVPKSIAPSNVYAIPYLLDQIETYPAVIKLLNGTHGMGVILADNRNTAESILEAFYATKEKVLLQKFVKEAAGVDIRAFVVGGEVVASMKRQAKKGDFRSNLHRGGTAENVILTAKEVETAIQATQILGLDVAGVDILRTHHGPCILEVNASPGLEGIEGVTGVDVAQCIIKLIEAKR